MRYLSQISRKSLAIATLAMLSLGAGIILSNSSVILISVPLVAYLVVSILFSSEQHPRDDSTKILINRIIDKNSIYEDETSLVRVDIVNQGSKINFLEVYDLLPVGLGINSGSNHQIVNLGSGDRFSFSYTVRPKVYGFYNIGPTLVRSTDIQGTIANEKVFESVASTLRVVPKIGYVPKINIRPKRTKNWPGEILRRTQGSGMEFYSLRDYDLGDPVKRINWKASSKTDEQLYTNQFMSELGGDTIIAVDARSVAEIGTPFVSTLTYSIRAAAIVAYRLLRDRNRVGMIVLGSMLEKVFPGFGKRQFDKILVALSMTKPSDIWEIRAIGTYLSQFFSTLVQIVFITPLTDDKSFDSIIDIARRGYRVLVISPSPIDVEKVAFKHNTNEPNYLVAERLLRVKRENRLNQLRRVAVVVDWDVSLPLNQALQEATRLWNKSMIV